MVITREASHAGSWYSADRTFFSFLKNSPVFVSFFFCLTYNVSIDDIAKELDEAITGWLNNARKEISADPTRLTGVTGPPQIIIGP